MDRSLSLLYPPPLFSLDQVDFIWNAMRSFTIFTTLLTHRKHFLFFFVSLYVAAVCFVYLWLIFGVPLFAYFIRIDLKRKHTLTPTQTPLALMDTLPIGNDFSINSSPFLYVIPFFFFSLFACALTVNRNCGIFVLTIAAMQSKFCSACIQKFSEIAYVSRRFVSCSV